MDVDELLDAMLIIVVDGRLQFLRLARQVEDGRAERAPAATAARPMIVVRPVTPSPSPSPSPSTSRSPSPDAREHRPGHRQRRRRRRRRRGVVGHVQVVGVRRGGVRAGGRAGGRRAEAHAVAVGHRLQHLKPARP